MSFYTTDAKKIYATRRFGNCRPARDSALWNRLIDFWLAMGAPAITAGDSGIPAPPATLAMEARLNWAHLNIENAAQLLTTPGKGTISPETDSATDEVDKAISMRNRRRSG